MNANTLGQLFTGLGAPLSKACVDVIETPPPVIPAVADFSQA